MFNMFLFNLVYTVFSFPSKHNIWCNKTTFVHFDDALLWLEMTTHEKRPVKRSNLRLLADRVPMLLFSREAEKKQAVTKAPGTRRFPKTV